VHFNNEGVMLISLVVAISIPAFGAREMERYRTPLPCVILLEFFLGL